MKGRECRSGSTMPHVAKDRLAWLRALCKLTSAAGEQGAHSGMFRTWSCRQRGPLMKSPRRTRQIYESSKSCLCLDSGFVIPLPGVRLTPVYSLVAALVSGALRQAIWENRGIGEATRDRPGCKKGGRHLATIRRSDEQPVHHLAPDIETSPLVEAIPIELTTCEGAML